MIVSFSLCKLLYIYVRWRYLEVVMSGEIYLPISLSLITFFGWQDFQLINYTCILIF